MCSKCPTPPSPCRCTCCHHMRGCGGRVRHGLRNQRPQGDPCRPGCAHAGLPQPRHLLQSHDHDLPGAVGCCAVSSVTLPLRVSFCRAKACGGRVGFLSMWRGLAAHHVPTVLEGWTPRLCVPTACLMWESATPNSISRPDRPPPPLSSFPCSFAYSTTPRTSGPCLGPYCPSS